MQAYIRTRRTMWLITTGCTENKGLTRIKDRYNNGWVIGHVLIGKLIDLPYVSRRKVKVQLFRPA